MTASFDAGIHHIVAVVPLDSNTRNINQIEGGVRLYPNGGERDSKRRFVEERSSRILYVHLLFLKDFQLNDVPNFFKKKLK